jgi:tRNA modification GTPase
VLEVALDLEGLPVTLLDTAGLRDSDDPVEREGIARARRRAAEADLRLGMLDATAPEPATIAGAEIVVVNKADLVSEAVPDVLAISCTTGAGIDALLDRLLQSARSLLADGGAPLVTRARHRDALAESVDALDRFRGAGGAELVVLAEELRIAAHALGRITGRVGTEEILDRIFATFCIGK